MFSIPTLSQVEAVLVSKAAELFGIQAGVRFNLVKILCRVFAAGVFLCVKFLSYMWKNKFAESADVLNLVDIGNSLGVPHKVAGYSHGYLDVTVSSSTNVAEGTVFKDPNGNQYVVVESVQISSGVASVKVRSVEYGSEYDLGKNVEMTTDEIETVSSAKTSSYGLTGGVSFDVSVGGNVEKWGESIESYRKRVVYRRQNPPQGGSLPDYVVWANSFNFVTDVYAFACWPHAGFVTLFVANFNNNNIVLSSDELAQVSSYCSDEIRSGVTANVVVANVTPVSVKLTIKLPVISEVVKNGVTEVISEYLKGVKPGEYVSKGIIKQIIKDSGYVTDAYVQDMFVSNVSRESYTLTRSYNQSTGIAYGQVFNVNSMQITYEAV